MSIHFIHNITKGCKLVFSIIAIHTVIDYNKANFSIERIDVRIIADLKIVSAKTGYNLDNDYRDIPLLSSIFVKSGKCVIEYGDHIVRASTVLAHFFSFTA